MESVKNPQAYQALLTINEQEASLKARSGYLKAYILSFFVPPIGVYYFIKYFFIADSSYGNRKAAFLSLVITATSLLLNIWLFNLFFSQFAAKDSVNEQFIQDLITPANQKELQQLFE
ncbi:hypothetical protein HYT02_03005 [Candidatus Gottesmanbacteria bacterium]|nr:hypothetical protein [Candidatus Gottesmanbacteria bacterium]